jgi:DNA topoisomerase 2-associated protein PAT1
VLAGCEAGADVPPHLPFSLLVPDRYLNSAHLLHLLFTLLHHCRAVRELAPTEKMGPGEVAFVKVEGLGRLPFSNIRRPRPLMDVAPGAPGGGADGSGGGQGEGDGQAGGSGAEGVPARPLDQEPLLAARIMIEDCMCLILDVLDIDQILVAGAGGELRLKEVAA